MRIIDKLSKRANKNKVHYSTSEVYNITDYLELSKELKDMFHCENEYDLDDERRDLLYCDHTKFEDIYSINLLNKLEFNFRKVLEIVTMHPYDIDTTAVMIEAASTNFIIDTLFHYGLMPERCNLVYCYIHNIQYIGEEDYYRFKDKELLKQLNLLLELNCYFLAICYEFTKKGNDYQYVRKFNKYKYVTVVCQLVSNIQSLR